MTTNEYVKLIRPAKSSFLIVQYTFSIFENENDLSS